MISYEEFLIRADQVRAQITEACRAAGRDPSEVTLLAVTKTHAAAAPDYAARLGLAAVGENRVQEAAEKKPLATSAASLRWELIGHLQSNKSRLAVETFDRIQSVDSEKLLHHLDRAAGELGKPLRVLLQINAGHDPAKFGADPADAPRLLETALTKKHLAVDGLMTIAPFLENPADVRPFFAQNNPMLEEMTEFLQVVEGKKAPTATAEQGRAIQSILTPHTPGLTALVAPVDPGSGESVPPSLVTRIIDLLRAQFDYVVVDTPPAFDEQVLAAFDASDVVALIATLDVPALKNLKLTLETLELLQYQRDKWRVVLNRAGVPKRPESASTELR